MKIAYVIINANRREGTSRAVLEVAERLSDDHQVDLLARTSEDVDLARVHWRRIKGPGWPEVGDFYSFVVLANRLLAKSDYDIIHAAGPNCSCADVYTIQTVHPVKCRVMKEVNAHQQASIPRRITRALYDKAVIGTEKTAYRAANLRGKIAYLPVSEGTREELIREYPVQEGLIKVVPNGADLDKFNPKLKEAYRSSIRSRCGFNEDDFVLIFSGGDWVRKGLRIAVEAIHKLANPRIKLLVVGQDPLADEFQKSLEPLALGNRVCFAGFQREVAQYYAAADLFVFPTAYEAFSLATIEAAASGLPVLMPGVSGAQELVGTGMAGMIVDRSSEAFAKAIVSLANDSSRMQVLSVGARRLVEDCYSWDVIAKSTEQVYKELLESRAASGTTEAIGKLVS